MTEGGVWIEKNGGWEVYNPDEEYIVDMKEDWQTGALLVYNNDFERYEPYGEPFQPAGVGYMVTNEFEMVYLMYDDGTMVCLENYGDGAFLSAEATGYSLIQMRGEKSYYDSSNGFWWSYGWDNWSFSIDGGSTWKEAPNLDIRMAADRLCNDYVGDFDGREWKRVNGGLEFMDDRFPQAGWLGMDQFCYDLYDGVGYDGEPLRLVVKEIYERESEEREFFQNLKHTLPPSGHEENDNSIPVGQLNWVTLYVYGERTDALKAKFGIPNPSTENYLPWQSNAPLNVLVQSSDSGEYYGIDARTGLEWNFIPLSLGTNVLWHSYDSKGYSFGELVDDLEALHYTVNKNSTGPGEILIKNLGIDQHANIGRFSVGQTDIKPSDFSTLGSSKLCTYETDLERLDRLMADGGQIQHYGCLIAGFDPYHDCANTDNLTKPGELENESWMARRMLSSIANMTKTFVYASSDTQFITVEWRYQLKRVVVKRAEVCLEFGIGPGGISVHYDSCSQELWNVDLWVPEGGKNTGSLQTMWDTDRIPVGAPPFSIPSIGEEGGYFYPFLWTKV